MTLDSSWKIIEPGKIALADTGFTVMLNDDGVTFRVFRRGHFVRSATNLAAAKAIAETQWRDSQST